MVLRVNTLKSTNRRQRRGIEKLLNIGRYRRGRGYYRGYGGYYYGGAPPQGQRRPPPKFNSFRNALRTGAQKLTNNASAIFRFVGDGAQIFEGILALNDLFILEQIMYLRKLTYQ